MQSPLAGLDYAAPQIMHAAGAPRHENTAERMLPGAVLGGLLGWMFTRRRMAAQLQALEDRPGIGDVQ